MVTPLFDIAGRFSITTVRMTESIHPARCSIPARISTEFAEVLGGRRNSEFGSKK